MCLMLVETSALAAARAQAYMTALHANAAAYHMADYRSHCFGVQDGGAWNKKRKKQKENMLATCMPGNR